MQRVWLRRSCRWVGRRLTWWHDGDPSGELTARQVDLLTAHLARCPRCLQAVREVRSVAESLARIARRRRPACRPATVELVRALLAAEGEIP